MWNGQGPAERPGRISLARQGPEGSTHPRPVDPPARQVPASNDTEPPRVLVVDDDEGFREVLRDFLLDDGFDVIGEARDGAEAVAATQRLRPDVILMDFRMPNLDGLQATRAIKEVVPEVQVIILSAYDDPGLKRGADEVGVYCYLIKGCPPSIVRDTLRFACQYKRGIEGHALGGIV
jgi:DNA-binding NarL/FixJ family response regulator